MEKKRNQSIQLIRIIAMFMIIFDHILCKISFPMQSIVVQIMNSGVFIFLLISGYLYGNKKIGNWKKWFLTRLSRICIPMWIFMTIDFAIEAILWEAFDIKYVIIYAFNMQGILGVNKTGANLWFLTLIMICYLLTPILQWLKNKKLGRIVGILTIALTIILQIVLSYITNIGMVAGHTLSWCVIAVAIYILGYFAGNIILSEKISIRKIVILTIFTFISSVVVLIFNMEFDGKVIYDKIVSVYGMVILDLWISIVVYKIGAHIKGNVLMKLLNHLDLISYEIYVVHLMIILTITAEIFLKISVLMYILSSFVLSWFAALILHKASERIYSFKRK